MKHIFFTISSIVLMSACSSVKTSSDVEVNAVSEYVLAKVTTQYKKDGCAYLLQTEVGLLNAYNMKEAFKKKDIQVYIKFKPTRMPQQGDCGLGTPILLDTMFLK